MNKEQYKKRKAEADKLTEQVSAIQLEMNSFHEKYLQEIAPFKKQIEELEQSFLDRHLIDSSGIAVKVGMTIEKDSKRYQVTYRGQQCIFGYLGNARVKAIPEGKKREIEIGVDELQEYKIVNE